MAKLTKSQQCAAEVTALVKARNSVIWVVTREEKRPEQYIVEAVQAANYVARTWDVGQGIRDVAGKQDREFIGTEDPTAAFAQIRSKAENNGERSVWIMRDLPVWLSGPAGAATLRQLRNLTRSLPDAPLDSAQSIVILTPSSDIPPELSGSAMVVEFPLPDREEIAEIFEAALLRIPEERRAGAAPNGTREAAIDAAVGLSGEEAFSCYGKSLVLSKRIDPALVSQEKKRVVAKQGMLQWIDHDPRGLESVGGLENLKAYLTSRRAAYSAAARAYGLPMPRGIMIVGVQGCGKSLTAKATAAAYTCPLLKWDIGAGKSKFVGESEANFRSALKVIESCGRCVVWIDEIEKVMQGATSGSADGGVSSDILGTLLNWMQERTSEAFVIATSNDISGLPPELLRKGRFDEIFWVDTPNAQEREQVLAAALKQYGRDVETIDLKKVASACKDFIGAEIAGLVPDAMFTAFNDGARPVTTADLIAAAATVVPLTKTAEKKITSMREWAAGKARPASLPEIESRTARKEVTAVDI